MTEYEIKESKEWLQDFIRMFDCNFDDSETRIFNKIVTCLEELKQYKEIGTVEELKSMKENGAFTGVELAQLAAMQMRLKEYSAIGTIEEIKDLKENQRKCEDCAGCTNWKCDCANIRDMTIDEFVEQLTKHEQENWIDNQEYGITWADIEQIAEEMRGAE